MKYVTVAFILMSRRQKKDYIAVFRHLRSFLPEPLRLKNVVADFESALRGALGDVFPEVSYTGCFFHWTQAVYRKVQQFGLAASYMRRSSLFKKVRSLLSLPLLPHAQIREAFEDLSRGVQNGQLQALLDYVQAQWINGTIPPQEWSVYRRLRRTDNHLEGYHHRLNQQALQHKMKPLMLLDLLDQEIELQEACMQMAQVNHKQRLSTTDQALIRLWDAYQSKAITTAEFLLEAGFPYLPDIGEEEEE